MGETINVLFIMEIRDGVQIHLERELEGENVNLIFPEDLEKETLLKLAPDAHVMVGWNPSKELLLAADNIRLFIVPWAGVQNTVKIFQEIHDEKTITMVNSHDNAYPTAQHGVALLYALMSRIVTHHNWMVEGKWRQADEGGAVSIPVKGRKFGFLGYGHVNRHVHRFLSCHDAEFAILRRDWKGKKEKLPTKVKKFTQDQLDDFLTYINTLIIAVPDTPETHGIIGQKELKLLGKDGVLVNIARGKVVDEKALYNALKRKTIAGAAIDVWYDYRPEEDEQGRKYPYDLEHPFHELDNIVLSPHRSASPYDSLDKWTTNIENIRRAAKGRADFINVVDVGRGY
jgi:phosphoglycerate dehydrogenase-like enzyme